MPLRVPFILPGVGGGLSIKARYAMIDYTEQTPDSGVNDEKQEDDPFAIEYTPARAGRRRTRFDHAPTAPAGGESKTSGPVVRGGRPAVNQSRMPASTTNESVV